MLRYHVYQIGHISITMDNQSLGYDENLSIYEL